MSEEEIIIDVKPDGSIEVSTPKIKGKRCKEVSKFLENSLGVKTDEKLTSAFYEPEEVLVKRKVSNGGQ